MTVFGVKHRLGLISPKWENQLYAVIANILNRIEGVRAIEIGGYKDHIHTVQHFRKSERSLGDDHREGEIFKMDKPQ